MLQNNSGIKAINAKMRYDVMKKVKRTEEICKLKNDEIYVAENGLYVRDVVIDAGIGEEVFIGHISDVHLNYCNKQDFDEAEPVIISTYENRLWCANGSSVPNLQKALEFLDDANQLVANGDILDYLSHGSMELMQRELWDKCPGIIATAGGHEVARQMQGKVADTLSRRERLDILEKYWQHDLYYKSRLVREKVLVIGMFNDLAQFDERQKEKLEADIKAARENGYVILLFAHEPIVTHNPEHKCVSEEDIMLKGDISGFPYNFCDGDKKVKIAGDSKCDDVTNEVYRLITENADVVKGFFAGHFHNDIHLDILAKTNDGKDTVIPQFINNALAYDEGHVMRILVK